ncbi:MAG TPA: endo-1,3-alpha-glucanase family glycosylhydrolase [Chthonomonadaceae bacterium]|nr:endo-1,3-alpha-glucanase family glycosylhydrolase [Chthonomonadaceae bacterium]
MSPLWKIALMALGLLMAVPACARALLPKDRPADPKPSWNLPGPAPHLLAHYMSWYQIEKGPGDATRTWAHWRWDGPGAHHDPEKRRDDGLRDIASVFYPLIGPYSSVSRAVVRYHLETARAAGIQGLIVDWYGIGDNTDAPIPLLLEEADRLGMRIAICYEEKLNFLWRGVKSRDEAIRDAMADLKYVVSRYTSNAAYLRRDGKPVIFQFDGWGEGPLGPKYFTPEELKRILGSLPAPVAYCRQGLTPAYHPEIPGAFQWWSSSAADIRGFAEQARQMVQEGKLAFFANEISPGFDDTGVWGWGDGARVTPRAGLSLLRATFDLAFTAHPELVQIVTWNDFNEGTVVEPTREHGFQYLDALATWWAQKRGTTTDLEAIRRPFLEYVRTCSPAERAELPPAPYDTYLKPRSLAVEVSDYLEHLAGHASSH